MSFSARAVILISSLLIAGCGGSVVKTQFIVYEPLYTHGLVSYVAGDRDFRTVILGNPTDGSKEAFDAAVISAMQSGYSWGPRTNFTTTPSETAREGYRIVLVFSGEYHLGGKAACTEPNTADLAKIDGQVELQTAFCFNERPISQVHVSFPTASAPEAAVLRAAVQQALILLFPPRDPEDGRSEVIIPG